MTHLVNWTKWHEICASTYQYMWICDCALIGATMRYVDASWHEQVM